MLTSALRKNEGGSAPNAKKRLQRLTLPFATNFFKKMKKLPLLRKWSSLQLPGVTKCKNIAGGVGKKDLWSPSSNRKRQHFLKAEQNFSFLQPLVFWKIVQRKFHLLLKLFVEGFTSWPIESARLRSGCAEDDAEPTNCRRPEFRSQPELSDTLRLRWNLFCLPILCLIWSSIGCNNRNRR